MRTKYQHHMLRRRAAALLLLRRQQRQRRIWVHPVNLRRREQGDYSNLVQELLLDGKRWFNYFRMSATQMETLLSFVGPDLSRQSTTFREPIEAKQWLAVAIRYMASGDSMRSLAYAYRLGVETVSACIEATCKAIERRMMVAYLPRPTELTWRRISRQFEEKWDFPHCIGSLDGKHINITAPPNSGSLYQNYKRKFSIVLLALVDADYRFTVIQVGEFGRASDGGVYASSDLGRGMAARTLQVPDKQVIPGAEELGDMPYCMVGDAAFPLRPYLMRPYGGRGRDRRQRLFDYRLCRARMTVEKAFGILASRWRVFYNDIMMAPTKVDTMVVAACILHNMLTRPSDDLYWLGQASKPHGAMANVEENHNRHGQDATAVRERFADYFEAERRRR